LAAFVSAKATSEALNASIICCVSSGWLAQHTLGKEEWTNRNFLDEFGNTLAAQLQTTIDTGTRDSAEYDRGKYSIHMLENILDISPNMSAKQIINKCKIRS